MASYATQGGGSSHNLGPNLFYHLCTLSTFSLLTTDDRKISLDSRQHSVTHTPPHNTRVLSQSIMMSENLSSDSGAADSVWSGECSVEPGGTRLVKLLKDRRLLVYDGVEVRSLSVNFRNSMFRQNMYSLFKTFAWSKNLNIIISIIRASKMKKDDEKSSDYKSIAVKLNKFYWGT